MTRKALEARRRVARRGAEDDVPARRQPRPGLVGRGDDGARRRVLRRLREARPDLPLPHAARAATRTSTTSSRSSRSTASAARSTSCTSAAACPATSSSCPKFLQWVQDGYKVYTDTSWAIGFGARWLLTEIEKHGRRRRPRVLRLRRAVVGLRQRVLEDQRHPRHLPGAQGARVLAATTRSCTRAVAEHATARRSTTAGCSSSCSRSACASSTRPAAALPGRRGGAGPSDALFLWVRGLPLTVPDARRVRRTRRPTRCASAARGARCTATTSYVGPVDAAARGRGSTTCRRPTACPYWKIALLHLDSIASTVVQKCIYWGTHEQCAFCGIELTRGEQTIPVKTPAQLAEVCTAARDLDGAVDVTLTTGSLNRRDRGALYIAAARRRSRRPAGCRSRCSSSRPTTCACSTRSTRAGVDAVGIHVETFDPEVLARVAPGKAQCGDRGLLPHAGSARSRCSGAAA